MCNEVKGCSGRELDASYSARLVVSLEMVVLQKCMLAGKSGAGSG